jgi:hypothetical protein
MANIQEPLIFTDTRHPKNNHLKEAVMPIPFPGPYDTLRQLACKGVRVPFDGFCIGCPAKGSFVYTGKSVSRGGVILSVSGDITYQNLWIPLACCSVCGRWARVLPQELLPRKTFGLLVIETAFRKYLDFPRSLRKAVTGIVVPSEHGPCHSTLSR